MKGTKKSLALSVLSLVLCVAMLLGTTFAWFTDSVTSGKNQIIAGNLDVELVSAKKGTVKADTPLFADVSKWEPGVAVYDTLTVKNVGNLALKYQMNLIFDNEIKVGGHGLSEVLKVGTFDGTVTANAKREDVITQVGSNWQSLASFVKSGNLAANTDDTAVTYVIYWEPGDNDNLFNMNNGNQGKTLSIDFYVELVATQDTVEIDSFNKLYDEKAFLPVISTAAVAESGDTVVEDETNEITVTAPEGSLPAGVTTLKLYVEEAAKPANIVVASSRESITAEVTLKDQDGNKIVANGTTLFTATMNVGKNRDNLKVYHSGVEMTKVVAPDVPDADNEYSYDSANGIVTMTITNFSPFTTVYDKESWASHAVEVEVGDITITTAEQLAGFAANVNAGKNYSGKTVTLGADIDLGEYLWKPISYFAGTFDGANHTISNLTIVDGGTYTGFFAQLGGTVKNVTFKDADVRTIASGGRAAVVAECTAWNDVLVSNVKILNSTVYSDQKTGGIIGFASGLQNFGCANVTVTGCTVDGLTFPTNETHDIAWQSGALIGYVDVQQNITVTNNTVRNVTIEYDPAKDYPTYPLYASHPLVACITLSHKTFNCSAYTITITGNTTENCTGFFAGSTATAYYGGCSNPVSETKATLIVAD